MQTSPDAAPKSGAEREKQVQQIFSEIAPRYDLLNHVLSLNIDRSWRRKAVRALQWESAASGTYLDACAGTYDLALELAWKKGFEGAVVASDFEGEVFRHYRLPSRVFPLNVVIDRNGALVHVDGNRDITEAEAAIVAALGV